ncbi:GTPase HflX [bacterium]|nr:GTPase HflX [bacterium]
MPIKAKGNTKGLKPLQKKLIDKLFERKLNPKSAISPEFAKALASISADIKRQIGILVDRKGHVVDVFIGTAKGVVISDFGRYRAGASRLRGLRLIHTRLFENSLNTDDSSDLVLLRLDMIISLEVLESGLPGGLTIANLLPFKNDGKIYEENFYNSVSSVNFDFIRFIEDLENEIELSTESKKTDDSSQRAILIHVSTDREENSDYAMEELKELATSAGIDIIDSIVQHRKELDPKYVIGKGKIKEILLLSMEKNANLIVFDSCLSASQMRSVEAETGIETIDRTQMILNIFAKRAKSREGKLQVKLAQLKYSLPRLTAKDDFTSRITGGSGGIRSRGPGETKLEISRRRVRESITALEKELKEIAEAEKERRKKRDKSDIPIISIVGYTNSGKSTLLNTLTQSDTYTEERMFATLDTATKRVRFPKDTDIIVTDTVGFIRDLPEELISAFRATLDEMCDSDILIHLFDISSKGWKEQIDSVNNILGELALDNIPVILVGNKIDIADIDTALEIQKETSCLLVSAKEKQSLKPLFNALENKIREILKDV